ncbi:GNAT family N-acetyltransferase [Kaistia adipata]|uniref:GNAT family N-acetyltransferase n=1 Tax=Kaistia adipata TaxID=166954 RepID=UPI0003F7C1A5|nr:GNAT family N-acetyltransferase [Kaistia adipata]
MRDHDADETIEDEERSVLTARLVLRRPRTDDAAILAAVIDNPRVASDLVTVPHPYRRADAAAWIAEGRAGAGIVAHIAVSRQTGQVVGAGCHRPSATRPGGHQLSFFVAEPHWGQGFGTEIAQATVDHAFATSAVERLWCAVRVTNGRARRVAAKCGFQFRDAGMVRSLAARGAVPVEHFVLEHGIWRSLKAWGASSRGAHSQAAMAATHSATMKDLETGASDDDDTSHAA